MNTLFLMAACLMSLSAAASPSPRPRPSPVPHASPTPLATPVCKSFTVPAGDGCNTCQVTKCNDGVWQWNTSVPSCTVASCVHSVPKQRMNPKGW